MYFTCALLIDLNCDSRAVVILTIVTSIFSAPLVVHEVQGKQLNSRVTTRKAMIVLEGLDFKCDTWIAMASRWMAFVTLSVN